jgi:hypothetical protein
MGGRDSGWRLARLPASRRRLQGKAGRNQTISDLLGVTGGFTFSWTYPSSSDWSAGQRFGFCWNQTAPDGRARTQSKPSRRSCLGSRTVLRHLHPRSRYTGVEHPLDLSVRRPDLLPTRTAMAITMPFWLSRSMNRLAGCREADGRADGPARPSPRRRRQSREIVADAPAQPRGARPPSRPGSSVTRRRDSRPFRRLGDGEISVRSACSRSPPTPARCRPSDMASSRGRDRRGCTPADPS